MRTLTILVVKPVLLLSQVKYMYATIFIFRLFRKEVHTDAYEPVGILQTHAK